VVIVDTRLAERLLPGQDPIGRRMCQGTPDRMDPRGWQTVVGVVGEVKQIGLVTDRPVGGVYYDPFSQYQMLGMTIVCCTVVRQNELGADQEAESLAIGRLESGERHAVPARAEPRPASDSGKAAHVRVDENSVAREGSEVDASRNRRSRVRVHRDAPRSHREGRIALRCAHEATGRQHGHHHDERQSGG
jgi:hypothetical protein